MKKFQLFLLGFALFSFVALYSCQNTGEQGEEATTEMEDTVNKSTEEMEEAIEDTTMEESVADTLAEEEESAE
ncbi:MAG: hypothetical protein ACOC3S_02590 [Bacteroidota bacterium]